MSDPHSHHHAAHPRRVFAKPMRARSPDEQPRASTPLELLFDLVFVVAVAFAGAGLHHALAEGHVAHGLQSYGVVFAVIWWAWMNFSWFASAYDTDDVLYRLTVFVQLLGALVIAAGMPSAFEGSFVIGTVGYTLMRVGTVTQWLRAAKNDPARRVTNMRYAKGIIAIQLCWIANLFLAPYTGLWTFFLFFAFELLIPLWAERPTQTTWHAEHIAERYGLFTIIVLGESILSASSALQAGMAAGHWNLALMWIALGGALIVFTMWWLYFDEPAHHLLTSTKAAFVWGYAHFFVFSSAAAVGAGLAVAVDHATGQAHISEMAAGAAVAVPVAVYVLSLWFVHERHRARSMFEQYLFPVGALLIVGTSLLYATVLWVGLLMSVMLAMKLFVNCSDQKEIQTK